MSERADFWAGHLAAIEAEGISTSAYAQREGLVAGSLYWWRRRLANAVQQAHTRGPSAFVPVMVASRVEPSHVRCAIQVGDAVRIETEQLPSAEWLAALSSALGRDAR